MLIHKETLPYVHGKTMTVKGRLLSVGYQGIYCVGWYIPQERYHSDVMCIWTGKGIGEETYGFSFVGTVIREHDDLVCHYFQRWRSLYAGGPWRTDNLTLEK